MAKNIKRGFGALVALVLSLGLAGIPASAAPVAANTPPIVTAAQDKAAKRPVGVRVPKRQPGANSTPNARLTTSYFYSGAKQTGTNAEGATVRVGIHKPYMQTGDYHTLAELAIIQNGANGANIVEVGWTRDPAVNQYWNGSAWVGSDEPHLFVYSWVNGNGQCYNGCGWVDYAPNPIDVGSALTSSIGLRKQFAAQYFQSRWWIQYDGAWLGYFPGTMWSGASPAATFTSTSEVQGFFELATPSSTPCSDMATGVVGAQSSATSGQFGSYGLVNPAAGSPTGAWGSTVGNGNTGKYHAVITSSVPPLSVWGGGPGWNAAGTGNGSAGSC
jgi:hypothetical protein